jgi:hypothetical protein
MTELLEQVITKLKTLPESEQDSLAAIILEELEDDIKWEKAFASSEDMLTRLATEAMEEYRAGKTQELNPETL